MKAEVRGDRIYIVPETEQDHNTLSKLPAPLMTFYTMDFEPVDRPRTYQTALVITNYPPDANFEKQNLDTVKILKVWSQIQGYGKLHAMLNGELSINDYLTGVENSARSRIDRDRIRLDIEAPNRNTPNSKPNSVLANVFIARMKKCEDQLKIIAEWRKQNPAEKQ